MTWLFTAGAVVAASVAVAGAVRRLGREIPAALETLADFGRELRPALIRTRTATEELRARTPQP